MIKTTVTYRMPTPKPNESIESYLDRCIPQLIGEGKDKDQATAICHSMFKNKSKNKEIQYTVSPISIKEEGGEFYSEGFIATTHPDRARDQKEGFVGDILSVESLKQIVNFINNSVATIKNIGSTRTVSERHDWIMANDPNLEPAGMAVPPAELREMDGGNYGVWVKTHHNKEHPDYKSIIYKVQNGYYPGYSIEYEMGDYSPIEYDGQRFRFLKSIKNFLGYAFASARRIANPMALVSAYSYKEVQELVDSKEDKEAINMAEEEKQPVENEQAEAQPSEPEQPEQPEQKEVPNEDEPVEEKKDEEVESEEDIPENKEVSDDGSEKIQIIKEKMKKGVKLNEEEYKMVESYLSSGQATTSPDDVPSSKEAEDEEQEGEEETPKVSAKEVADQIISNDNFKKEIENVQPVKKVKHSEEMSMENINIKQMNEAIQGGLNIKENIRKYTVAAEEALYESKAVKEAFADVERYGNRQLNSNLRVKAVDKGLLVSGNIKVKGTLGSGAAVNASTYTQDDVEFADVFAPGIIDTFNNQTNLFGFLKKESHTAGAGSFYQWKMITDQDPETVSTFVGQGDTSISKTYSAKDNYQTPLKIARRGVSVTDFIQRYSAKSLGDLFRLELDVQMKKMMNDVDAALFAEVADGTGNAPLGLEAVADSVGNTTLYGLTRSTANRLSPDTAADTYEAIAGDLTEGKLRSKITYLRSEGSILDDLAIVAHPTSYGYLLNLLDGNRRFMTTGATFGFNQKMVAQFDGLPVIVDHNCPSDALFVIDSSQDACAIVIGQEPKIISLAKVGAATEAYVQMDFAFVYKQPRRISMLDTLSGPAA